MDVDKLRQNQNGVVQPLLTGKMNRKHFTNCDVDLLIIKWYYYYYFYCDEILIIICDAHCCHSGIVLTTPLHNNQIILTHFSNIHKIYGYTIENVDIVLFAKIFVLFLLSFHCLSSGLNLVRLVWYIRNDTLINHFISNYSYHYEMMKITFIQRLQPHVHFSMLSYLSLIKILYFFCLCE